MKSSQSVSNKAVLELSTLLQCKVWYLLLFTYIRVCASSHLPGNIEITVEIKSNLLRV